MHTLHKYCFVSGFRLEALLPWPVLAFFKFQIIFKIIYNGIWLPSDSGQWSCAGIPDDFCVFVYLCICESKSLEGPLVLPADPGHVREFLMIFPLISNKLFRFSPQTRTRRRPVSFFLTYLARTTCFPGLKSRQLN